MVYYTGLGYFAIIGFLLAMIPMGGLVFGMGYTSKNSDFDMVFLAVSGLAGLFVFVWGRYLNRRPIEVVELRPGGTAAVKKTRHTLSNLPMEYWGPILFAVFACITTYNSLPIFLKGKAVPQKISVQDLAAHGAGDNINVQIKDFQIGGKLFVLRGKDNTSGGTTYLPLFPPGQAQGGTAPKVVAYRFIKDDQALAELTKESTLSGIVINGIKDVKAAREAISRQYAGIDGDNLIFVDLGQRMASPYDAYLSPLLAVAAAGFVFWLRKKDTNRWQ